MATLNVDELRNGIISKFMPGVRDQVINVSYLMKRLYDGEGEGARGAERYRSGDDLNKMLSYKIKPSTLTNGRDTSLTASFFEAEKQMFLKYRWRVADVVLYDEDLSANKTGEKIFDLMGKRIKDAIAGLRKDVGVDIVTGNNTTNSLQIDGAQQVVSDNNTYAGIDRVTNTWFQSKVVDESLPSSIISLAKIDKMHDTLTNGLDERPTLQVTTKLLWREVVNQIAAKYSVLERSPKLLEKGVENVILNGSPVIDDINIPVGEYYHLNEKVFKLYVDPDYDISLSEWETDYQGKPHARALFIKFAYVLYCEEPRLCGKHKGFTTQ